MLKKTLPKTIWAAIRVHGEILANAANLKAVMKYCREGEVATAELSELIGSDQFKEIDPEQTDLLELDRGPHGSSLLVRFAVKNKLENISIEISARETKILLISLIAILIVILILVWLLKRRNESKRKKDIPQKDYHQGTSAQERVLE